MSAKYGDIVTYVCAIRNINIEHIKLNFWITDQIK